MNSFAGTFFLYFHKVYKIFISLEVAQNYIFFNLFLDKIYYPK